MIAWFFRSILCAFGFHQWEYINDPETIRLCANCPKRQELVFYSNHTHEWKDYPDGFE